jgi:hypothetical protein
MLKRVLNLFLNYFPGFCEKISFKLSNVTFFQGASVNQTPRDIGKRCSVSDSPENFNCQFYFSISDLDRLPAKPVISVFRGLKSSLNST